MSGHDEARLTEHQTPSREHELAREHEVTQRRHAAPPTEVEVRAALNEIVDPCSAAAGAPAGLDEMGLVREVEIRGARGGGRGEAHIRVTIGLTQPLCLMGIPFLKSARERLSAMPGVADVEVSLASGIDWTPARLAPGYRERLERVRRARGMTDALGGPR
jgi:metal-sulfur cluster biosynthetic enzyme